MYSRIYYVFFLVLLLTGCTVSIDQNAHLFNGWSIDSLRQALETRRLTAEEEMIASGKLGINYNATGQYDSARVYLNRALLMPGGVEYQGGRFITNLANSYAAQGEYAKALKHYVEALNRSEQPAVMKSNENEKRLNVVRAMSGVARMYYLMGNNEQAFHYSQQAKAIEEEQGWSYITPQHLYIIGAVYLDRGEWNDAERTMRQTLEIADSLCQVALKNSGDALGLYMHVAQGQEGLARVALARKEYAEALEYASKAVNYAELHGNPAITARMLAAFSDIYLAQGNYAESGRFARKALELFPDYPKVNPAVEFNIAAAALFTDGKEEAYKHFLLYSTQMKENTDKQFRETMAGLEIVYETEKKETRITSLEKERQLYVWLGIAGLMFTLSLGVVLWLRIRNSQKERQLIASNAVQEGEMSERERIAGELHDRLLGSLSAVKSEIDNTHISNKLNECIEEVRRISRNLMPLPLRNGIKTALEDFTAQFSNVRFHFFGQERRVEKRLEFVVYCCANELVSNSIRYSGAKNINIQLIQGENHIALTVQDDGCGFDEKTITKGVGLKSIRDRVASCNGKMEIFSSPDKGTETVIEINI